MVASWAHRMSSTTSTVPRTSRSATSCMITSTLRWTGPFRFVNYTPGDKLEMARFDQYWEQGKPYVDKVTIKIIPDPQARLANLRGGTVDFVDSLAPSDL